MRYAGIVFTVPTVTCGKCSAEFVLFAVLRDEYSSDTMPQESAVYCPYCGAEQK